MRYENIHKHSKYSNIFTPDCVISPRDIAARAVELGHKTIATTEHGYAGNVFEYYDVAKEYGLKMIFGIEFYYVTDRFQSDKSNTHLLMLAKNNAGKKQLTKIMSEASKTGYYFKPRIDRELLLSLNPNDVVVTSTCVASYINKFADYEEEFLLPIMRHFKENFYLEIQPHVHPYQIAYNKKIKAIHDKYNIPYILGIDTHYIHPEDAQDRDVLLAGKGIVYEDEEGFILDYPTTDTVFERFEKQGVFTRENVEQAIQNTLIVDEFEDIVMNKDIKMPTLYPNWTHEQKIKKLKDIIKEEWKEDKKNIDKNRVKEYIDAIKFEMDIIEATHMEDYFLLNYEMIKRAKEKGGVLTKTGRGCFTEDALVHTKKGLKQINEVVKGDHVINMNGEFDKVVETWEYEVDEELIKIKHLFGTDKHYPTICTKDHKILIKRSVNDPQYIKAEDIQKNDYVCLPKMKHKDMSYKSVIDLNDYNCFSFRYDDEWIYEEFARGNVRFNKKIKRFIEVDELFNKFVGLMYADGWTITRRGEVNGVGLALNTSNHKNTVNRSIFTTMAERFNLVISEEKHKNKNLTQLVLYSKILGNLFVKEFFKSKKGMDKNFNEDLFNQPQSKLKALREGMFLADGSFTETENRENYDSTSYALINAYKILCLMTDKQPHSLVFRKGGVDSRGYNRKDSFKLRARLNKNVRKKSCQYLEDENYFYLPVSSIENIGKVKTKVFDLQVENNPSFLINNMIVHNSGPSFYLNKLLGFTEVDRLDAPVTLYPTRFMSKSRILETNSLPDVDFNTANPHVFSQAGKEVLGEDNVYVMTAFGTMKESAAFRNICRSKGMEMSEYNDVAKNLDSYRTDPKWQDLITYASKFVGVIDSASPHPCAFLLLTESISEEVGVIRIGNELCAVIDSTTSDNWKFLKNDWLAVTVWEIISDCYKLLDKPIPNIREITKLVENNESVWSLYEKGMTATLNQTGTDSGNPQVMLYKPKSVRELTGWVSAIRPSFASMKSYFLNRIPFSYDIPAFDDLLKSSDNFILYQEDIMKTLVYAGFSEDETYGLLKAIAKKKPGIIEPIHDKFINGFSQVTNSKEQTLKVWKILEDSVGYSFNSSHAYSVALDSLYGAYLKATYPLEYFTTVLNVYQKEADMTAKIMKELPYFNIGMNQIKYGKSKETYSFDKNTNSIYKGIGSIKYLNESSSTQLSKLSQNTYVDFVDFVIDVLSTSIDTRQMNILIRLDFFRDFGPKEVLLEVYNCMADKRKANIERYPAFAPQTITEQVTKIHKKTGKVTISEKLKVVKKSLKCTGNLTDQTKEQRIKNAKEYFKAVSENPPVTLDIHDQIIFEQEYLGYAILKMPEVKENLYVVTDISIPYTTPILTLYRLRDGVEHKIKMSSKNFFDKNKKPLLEKGNVIEVKEVSERPKTRKIDTEWVKLEECELWLEKCIKLEWSDGE